MLITLFLEWQVAINWTQAIPESVPKEFQCLEDLIYQLHSYIGSCKTSIQTDKWKHAKGAGNKEYISVYTVKELILYSQCHI